MQTRSKAGGALVVMTPCKFHPPILLGRAIPYCLKQLINLYITGTKIEDTFPAFYRANSAGTLRRLAFSTGLHVVGIEYLSNHPQYFMFSTFFYRCAVAVERHILQREAFCWLRERVLCQLKYSGEMDVKLCVKEVSKGQAACRGQQHAS